MTRRSQMFKAMPVVLCALGMALAGCGQPMQEEASAPAQAPAPPSVEERVAFYQECWDRFNAKAWESFAECYGADAQSENLDSGMPVARGRDAVVQGAKDFVAAFPDVTGSLQVVIANAQEIAALSLLTGTHTGPLGGGPEPLPATNMPIGLYMGHVVMGDPASTLIAREALYNENGTLTGQLGVSSAPHRPVMTSGAASPTLVIAGGSETEAANLQAIRAQYDAFNAHDVAGIGSYNAESVVFHGLADPQDSTAADFDGVIEGYFTAFPDVKITLESSWAAGDYVVARGTFGGTNTGAAPAMGIAEPTGKAVSVHFLEIMRLANGKVVEDWLIYDGMAFATQLGLTGP